MDINNLKLSDLNVFNHTNYTNDRETKSTLIFDSGSESLPISSQVFTKTLEADFIIDNKSDVYLDSFTSGPKTASPILLDSSINKVTFFMSFMLLLKTDAKYSEG